MLSIGKLSFSPKREQTPNALSSKNIFSFSMVIGEFVAVNLRKKSRVLINKNVGSIV